MAKDINKMNETEEKMIDDVVSKIEESFQENF